MKVSVEPREQYTILHLRGEFDTFYCSLVMEEVDALIKAGVIHVVLNMRLVRFINSTALSAVIRCSKRLRERDGRLTVARPSPFARQVMEKVQLDKVVPIFDSDESAGEAALSGVAGTSPSVPSEEESATILFTLADESRIEHFIPLELRSSGTANPVHGHVFGGRWRGIGTMLSISPKGIRFTWSGGRTQLTPFEIAQMLSIGTELKVKFRLHMYEKGHHSAVVTVEEIEERPDDVKLGAVFSELDDATRKALQQYAEDLDFLKRELA